MFCHSFFISTCFFRVSGLAGSKNWCMIAILLRQTGVLLPAFPLKTADVLFRSSNRNSKIVVELGQFSTVFGLSELSRLIQRLILCFCDNSQS